MEKGEILKNKKGEVVKCDCGGVYKWDGKILCSYPAQYNFRCDKCHDVVRIRGEWLFPEKYPEYTKKQ